MLLTCVSVAAVLPAQIFFSLKIFLIYPLPFLNVVNGTILSLLFMPPLRFFASGNLYLLILLHEAGFSISGQVSAQ